MTIKNFWDQKHKDKETPWAIKDVSPPLMTYMEQIHDKNLKILIPGAGHEHDAIALVQMGFTNITLCDISPTAIQNIIATIGTNAHIRYIVGDFFMLQDSYDIILEQTFFCAIEPQQRNDYVEKMKALLSKNGKLVGILFSSNFEKQGPPYGGTEPEYKALFGKHLHIVRMEMCYNSIKPRAGNELFFICQKYIN